MEGEIRIYGKVRNQEGQLIQGAEISIKDSKLRDIAKGKSNDLGEYEFFVQAGQHTAFSAVAEQGTTYLPYWEWNFAKMEDCEIDVTLGTIEIYAANVLIPVGTFPQFMIFFRPMSLSKLIQYKNGPKANKGEIVDVAPDITIEDIELTIDGQKAKIFTLNKVEEFGGDNNLNGYFMTTQRPIEMNFEDYTKIEIKIHDKDTNEYGKGVLYY